MTFQPRNIRAAWTDYTPAGDPTNPNGPWPDQTQVTRNYDGVGFIYNATINALTIIPNQSWVTKDANNFPIINVPDPVNNLDAANKEYVDASGGGGGGIPDAPSDSTLYGRENATWVHAVPLAGGTMTGLLTLSAVPTASLGAATKGYVDGAVPVPSSSTPAMDGTGAVGTSTLYARGDHVHPSDTTKANLASPTFTGAPAAPTATAGTATTQLATTAFVGTAITNSALTPSSVVPAMDGTGAAGTATTYSRGDHVHPSDTTKANLASPTFTGTPAAPTPATADSSTTIATTAFVKAQGYLTGNQTVTLSGDITGSGATAITTTLATVNANVGTFQGITVNAKGLVTGAANQSYAPLASPTFTGTPAAPTATAGTSTTQLATTAFVGTAVTNAAVPGPATVAPIMDSTAAVGTSLLYARQDHVHPSDTTKANLASPTFTGTPAAPTASVGTNTTQLATTAFVLANAGSSTPSSTTPIMDGTGAAGTATTYARGDHVHPSDTSRAPLASPTFTGTPAAPTPAANDNTTKLATTAFVVGQAGTATPIVAGTAAVGTSLLYARQDHVHPSGAVVGRVRLAASQTISGSTATKVNFDTVDFDPQSSWNATNHQFNPQTAGTYLAIWAITAIGTFTSGSSVLDTFCSKNGLYTTTGTQVGEAYILASGTGNGQVCGSTLVQMNGTTDTLELDVNIGGGSSIQGIANMRTRFEIVRVGP